jgi:polysaccharide biosynthesis transport protein
MTTLPQTTGIRLPRPAGAAPPMVAGGPMHLAHGGSAAAAGAGMTAADIWRVLRANTWLIVILMFVAAVIGFLVNLYLAKYYSRFTSSALVEVMPKSSRDTLMSKAQEYTDWTGVAMTQRSQAQVLQHEGLFSRVLGNPNSAIRQKTNWFKQFVTKTPDGKPIPDVAAAKAELVARFTAAAIPESTLIRVDFSCPDPEDSRVIVEEVIQQFLDDAQNNTQNRVQDRSQGLNNLRVKYETRIRELTDRQQNRMLMLDIGQIGSPGRYTATDLEMQSAVNKHIEHAALANSYQAAYESMDAQIRQGIDPAQVEEMVERDMSVMSYKDSMVRLKVAIEAMTMAGSDSRQRRELELQREAFGRELEDIRGEKRAQARVALLEGAKTQAQQAKELADTDAKKVEQLKQKLGDLAIAMSDYLSITDELASAREDLKDIKQQLDALGSGAAQSPVVWAQRPVRPDQPSFPKLPLTMSIAIVIGVVIALGIAFTRELMDTSVRSPRDIARVGQMNLLGMIPHEEDDPQSAGAPLPLVIFQAPTSIMAEQYRQVRTRLQYAASLDTTRSIVVTSPAPGDGKTTVACNLACGLALNGRKILLVDANFRRPDLNKIFSIPNDVGLSNALASLDNFEGAIRSTQVPNLDVMATGLRPANPTELLESQLLTDFIERALEEYDHVIFDTGPMLLVSETAAMAPRVDGVISVVRAATNSRGLLQRLRDGLRQLKAEHLGVVLNGVRAQAGGYYNRNIKTYYEYQNGQEA